MGEIISWLSSVDAGMAVVITVGWTLCFLTSSVFVHTKPYGELNDMVTKLAATGMFVQLFGFTIGLYVILRYDSFWSVPGFIICLLCGLTVALADILSSIAQKYYDGKEDVFYDAIKGGLQAGDKSLDVDALIRKKGDTISKKANNVTGLLVPSCLLGLVYLLLHGNYGWATLDGAIFVVAAIKIGLWASIVHNRPFIARVRLDNGEIIEKAVIFYLGETYVRLYASNEMRIINRDHLVSVDRSMKYGGKEAAWLETVISSPPTEPDMRPGVTEGPDTQRAIS